ncbi:MAG TPA: hypothetical protein VMZ29_02145 [Candidatus Bathyarchaeia archaeon]|nr:hypothetical protein [Candidatus Bathyarchaeia archaeon]
MSEEAKNLLMRLKKEKKVNKQIELVQALKEYNQLEMVNHVLLIHLERKDHDSLRMEILAALNYEDEAIVKPLVDILNDSKETQAVKEKVLSLLGQNKGKKAMSAVLTAFKKIKDPKIKDNITYALTFFEDTKVVKPLVKSLQNDDLRLQALTGLSRNEILLLSSLDLIKTITSLDITRNFEKLHYENILDTIFDIFGYKSKEEIIAAIKDKSINQKIQDYQKKQLEIKKTLKKVR